MTLGSSGGSSGARWARQLAARCLASGLVLSTAVSQAEPVVVAADAARAERLFDEGRLAMEEHSFAFACAAFAESQKLDPAPGTLVNWGVCLEAQGKIASALEAYKASLSGATPGADPDRERFVEDRMAALEPRLCRVTVTVRNAPAGVRILLDAGPLGPSQWNTPLPAEQGAHWVEVSAPGYRNWSEAFTLDSDGAVRSVEVPDLEPAGPAAPRTDSKPPRPPDPAPFSGARRVELIVAGSVLLAGAATTAYFGARAASAWDERQRNCVAHRCNATAVAASERAAAFARAADVAAVVTVAALGFGLYVVLSSTRSASPARSSLLVRGEPAGAQVQWSGEF
jgi:tetratricopeptide (TPR) repeat protein